MTDCKARLTGKDTSRAIAERHYLHRTVGQALPKDESLAFGNVFDSFEQPLRVTRNNELVGLFAVVFRKKVVW
jgi:hypothetical protein